MQSDYIPGAIPSLVLGLLSTILAIVLGFLAPYIPLALGIIGIVLSANAARYAKNTVVTAGFILSLVGIVLSAVFLILWLACVGATASIADAVVEGIREGVR